LRENELRLIAAYEESSRLQNAFLANVSHEIRTPMHGLLSACGLLLDTTLTDDQRETANIISESGQVLLSVINSILDYSKLTSGTFTITSEAFSVAKVVTSVVRTAQTTLIPGVHIKLHLAPNLPGLVLGDQFRFRQIMQNIIDNAAKFTEEGYVSVSCSVREETDTCYLIITEVVVTRNSRCVTSSASETLLTAPRTAWTLVVGAILMSVLFSPLLRLDYSN